MTIRVPSSRRRRQSPSRSNFRLQKPKGSISPRVKEVGGEHFAIVCVDPAKHRSEWMMADFFGNVLIEPRTLEHQGGRNTIYPEVTPVRGANSVDLNRAQIEACAICAVIRCEAPP